MLLAAPRSRHRLLTEFLDASITDELEPERNRDVEFDLYDPANPNQPPYSADFLAAYRDPVDPGQLVVCEQLRRLHLTVWYNLYAERLPELGPRAAELLASWPAA